MRSVNLLLYALIFGVAVLLAQNQSGRPSPVMPGDKDKCPVCGMFVKPYPKWVSEIIYQDGTVIFFDGAKDMFKYYLHPEKYGGSRKKKIAAIYLRDYYDLDWIDARTAYFVIDSDILGPMGNELVPLKTLEDAREFKSDHHGSKILRFDEVDWELLMRLSVGQEM